MFIVEVVVVVLMVMVGMDSSLESILLYICVYVYVDNLITVWLMVGYLYQQN